jgi:hypothetical protein
VPVVPLVLVTAEFDAGAVPAPTVTLAFDRAIDIAGLVGGAITVDDGPGSGTRWEATLTATMLDPQTVRIDMLDVEPSASAAVLLDATAGNGIVAVDDGGTWGGVSELELPFP